MVFKIQFYIPLCFYFIGFKRNHRHHIFIFYIPLCFYFIGSRNYYNYISSSFYIPLCFYFINKLCYIWLFPFFYIPLCFYFISLYIFSHICLFLILHSTMLLLYPRELQSQSGFPHLLHSTMLLLYRQCSFGTWLKITFTFHYASTLSQISGIRSMSSIFLHSTMLLLYLN